jgi:hypothetical protein
MNISKQVVILSAEKAEHTPEVNKQRTKSLKGCLQDCNISFNEAIGVFEHGAPEASLVAIVNDDAEYQAVIDFAFKNFDQDAVLHQDANQEGYLVYPDGKLERLGRLREVSKKVALEKGSYTLLNGTYFTTIPRT